MQFEQRTCEQIDAKTVNNSREEPPEKHLCPIILRSLDKIIKNENYSSYNINNSLLSTNGGNYLGDLIEIDIKGEAKDGQKENHLFIKHTVPEGSAFNGILNTVNGYSNEILMYNEITKIFVEFYNEASVPDEERLRTIKTYDCNNHVIILENLSRKGFKCLNRMDLISLDFAEDSIKQLAKLHGMSFVLEKKKPGVFEDIIKKIKPVVKCDLVNGFNDTWSSFITLMVNTAFDNISDEYKDKKELIIKKCLNDFSKFITGKTGTVKCLCHGDCKLNNILMKERDDEGVETVLIDYQLIDYGSPVRDILFFLYTGSDRKFRKDYLEFLKDTYHNTLTKTLHNFDLDVNEIYPKTVFENEFVAQLDFGLICSMVLLTCFMTDEPEFFTGDMSGRPKINEQYKERINGVIEEFVEWGLW